MDLDMEEVTERFDKATGKLKGLESNHNMIKKKLSLMASIITGINNQNIFKIKQVVLQSQALKI